MKNKEKHFFKPSDEDKDFCEVCGTNFRNLDMHWSSKDKTTPIGVIVNPYKIKKS